MNYVVIHKTPLNENAEVFGPFENITDCGIENTKETWEIAEFFGK